MKRILNPWIGIPAYQCFGCSPQNPYGLHMQFLEEGEDVVSIWHPSAHFQGWVNTMHGGILSALIDETCGWVVTRKKQTAGFTMALNIRFRKKVSTDEDALTIRARITDQKKNLLFIHAEVLNGKGEICTEGDATYYLLDEERSRQMGFTACGVEE